MESKNFNRDDIKAGYLLVVEDIGPGVKFNMTVVPSQNGLGCCGDSHWWPLSHFCFDTLDVPFLGYEIIKVYGPTVNKYLLRNSTKERELLWARPQRSKKMTVKEICDALGYDVEIVKEEEAKHEQ